ncbi:MAG: hypothetical protein BWY26_01481 [Elusimicrobia bacterium ADurb.Bin231]|nr:MAG: hypothetical protein BWY26_01481 [Elusimicrobia bacterium ADurb.Bin231]
MEFSKTQTQLIVLEIVLIFIGALAVTKKMRPRNAIVDYRSGNISTVTISSLYAPPSAKPVKKIVPVEEETFTVSLEESKKVKKKPKKIKRVKKIDIEEFK